jgi:hypothetical protein
MAVFSFDEFLTRHWEKIEEFLAFGKPWGTMKTLPLHRTPHLPPVSDRYPIVENAIIYDLSVAAGSEPSGLPFSLPASALQLWPDKRGNVPYIHVKVGNGPVFRLPAKWHYWFGIWLYDRSVSYDNRRAPLLPWEDFRVKPVSYFFSLLWPLPWPPPWPPPWPLFCFPSFLYGLFLTMFPRS